MPHDLPPWAAVYQQSQRWFKAGAFEAIVDDLRALLKVVEGRNEQPAEVIIDSCTLQSTPESGGQAGDEGGNRKKDRKVHIAVNTLSHLLGLVATPANEQEQAQVQELAQQVQQITGETVVIAFVEQGYTRQASRDRAEADIQLQVVKLPCAKKGFVLLPRRWIVERSFAWAGQFRRLARDYERLEETLVGFRSGCGRRPHA